MFIRKTQLIDLDKNCEMINGLARDPEFHPLRTAELLHKTIMLYGFAGKRMVKLLQPLV